MEIYKGASRSLLGLPLGKSGFIGKVNIRSDSIRQMDVKRN